MGTHSWYFPIMHHVLFLCNIMVSCAVIFFCIVFNRKWCHYQFFYHIACTFEKKSLLIKCHAHHALYITTQFTIIVLVLQSLSCASLMIIFITKLSISSDLVSVFSLIHILKYWLFWVSLYKFFTVICLTCTFSKENYYWMQWEIFILIL